MNICWVDLETQGTDEQRDEILEVGVIITDMGLNERARVNWVVRPVTSNIREAEVLKMHTDNGLLEECENSGWSIFDVEANIVTFIDPYLENGRIVLGGSGVLHFDRRFIAKYMPHFNNRLTHWGIDVGVIRRFLRAAGVKIGKGPNKPHRAMDDIAMHVEEARRYRVFLQRASNAGIDAI